MDNPFESELLEAVDSIASAIASHTVPALHCRGIEAHNRGEPACAVDCFEQVLEVDPNRPEVLNDLACALWTLQRGDEAIACLQRALALRPDYVPALKNLGAMARATDQSLLAVEMLTESIRLAPQSAEARHQLGLTCRDLERFTEAVEAHGSATAICTNRPDLFCALGDALQAAQEFAGASTAYQRALRLDPEHVSSRLGRANLLLTLGEWTAGFGEHAWCHSRNSPRTGGQSQTWTGTDLAGRTLQLCAENDLRDVLQYIRFVPSLAMEGTIQLAATPSVANLLASSGLPIEFVSASGGDAGFDVQAALARLPGLRGVCLATLRSNVPYIKADIRRVRKWRERTMRAPGFRIGVHGQSDFVAAGRCRGSVPLSEFAPLKAVPGIQFIAFQKLSLTEQSSGVDQLCHDWASQLEGSPYDLADLAAAIQCLDLVVTTDSIVAHLAGALGIPVWLAVPVAADWRWLLYREDSPWYPSMRLFRQQEVGNWTDVFASMSQVLRSVLAEPMFNHSDSRSNPGNGLENQPSLHRHAVELIYWTGVQRKLYGDRRLAAKCFEAALKRNPQHAASLNEVGCMLLRDGRATEAVELLDRAHQSDPTLFSATGNLGCALRAVGKMREAEQALRAVVRALPDSAAAHNNLGNFLQVRNRFDEALLHHARAVAIDSRFAEGHNGVGAARQRLGDFAGAMSAFDTAIGLEPNHVEARLSRALVYLSEGDVKRGWPEYEWRFKLPRYQVRHAKVPRWDGSSLDRRMLLVHAEQGLGDTLQFVRFLHRFREDPSQVICEVQNCLVPLLRQSGFTQVVGQGTELPAHDLQIPLMSLPAVFQLGLQDIRFSCPYLAADPGRVEYWADRLNSFSISRVGIAWQGSPTFRDDVFRSIPLFHFAALAPVPGVQLVSLQKGPGLHQITSEVRSWLLTLGDEFDASGGAFLDTAAVMKNLDLVITSDSAVAHLAGALGVPVWVALHWNPEWRWLRDRYDSPWYPSMRLFRQSARGGWSEVFEEMKQGLVRSDFPAAGSS